MLGPAQFRPAGPPRAGSAAFAAGRSVVAILGAARSSVRTPDQTQIAHYWSDGTGTYTPPGHWNAIAVRLATPFRRGTTIEAELFAELNVAMADAAIAAADAKLAFHAWRPITAIRVGDADEPAVPGWTPLLETPNHPSYVSGHSAFSGAAAAVLTAWFGPQPFSFASSHDPPVTRTFASFDGAAEEASISRIYAGIHYPFDAEDGLTSGRAADAWTLSMFQRNNEERGPFIMIDPLTLAKNRGPRPLMGCALDNLAPIATVTANVDGGEPFKVAVDGRGIFALRTPGPIAPGRHEVRWTATSVTGRMTAVRLVIETDNAGDAVAVPVPVRQPPVRLLIGSVAMNVRTVFRLTVSGGDPSRRPRSPPARIGVTVVISPPDRLPPHRFIIHKADSSRFCHSRARPGDRKRHGGAKIPHIGSESRRDRSPGRAQG